MNQLLQNCTGFQWDKGNETKNWHKHRVSQPECEQIFFNQPLVVVDDEKHSQGEVRFQALGRTNLGRELFLVFTIRDRSIRVVSARNMNKKERSIYEQAKENTGI